MTLQSKKSTSDHLKEIDDEVSGLHPILQKLFTSLPSIDRVHYNHGPGEMGADFVLQRKDDALDRLSYIGVVAKVDSIRQDTRDVDRQIDECFISRLDSDSKEIQIREVWVVTSKNITNNARQVFARKYREKNVQFISCDDLAGLIEKYAPESFVTIPPKLQHYAQSLLEDISVEDSKSLIVPGVDAFYIEPAIKKLSLRSYGKPKKDKKIQSLDALIGEILKDNVSFIEASAGGGKSKLGRELAKRIIDTKYFQDDYVIPKIIHAKDLLENLISRMNDMFADVQSRSSQISKLLYIIDGFDEIEVSDSHRKTMVRELCECVDASDKISALVLSRPFDKASILSDQINVITVYSIEPLRGTKAIEFLQRVGGQVIKNTRVVSDLHKSILMRALDGAPIAYMLLGRLLAENKQELPSNLTELFQKYTELVLGRWEIAKGLRSQQEYDVLVEALIWMSGYFMDNEIDEISISEFKDWVDDYCARRRLDVSSDNLIKKVSDRGSILYLRKDTNCFGFRHRAFCEFFYAKGLSCKSNIVLDSKIFSLYWQNSYFFLAGVKKDCPDLLTALIDLDLSEESQRLLRAFSFGNFLLAGYLTPLGVANAAVKKLACDLSQIYLDACDPLHVSPLTDFPTIQLLCIFTNIFREQYGYSFFKNALEEAVFDLEEEDKNERNAIAIFFLHTAYEASGGELRFDSLIESYGSCLPLVVKIAITHEVDRMKNMSNRVKKMERNLKRSFKGASSFLKNMYEIPIKDLDKKLVQNTDS